MMAALALDAPCDLPSSSTSVVSDRQYECK